MRRAAKVDISQAPIVAALRAIGDRVYIIGRPVDLLVRSGSVYWSAEVKTPGKNAKREMPIQVEHRKDAQRFNAPHYILMSIEDAIRVHNVLVHSR